MQMAKPRQARNKVVANALTFCRQEQLRNCFSFREKKKRERKKLFLYFFLFLVFLLFFFNVTDVWPHQAQPNGLVLPRNYTFLVNSPSALSCVNAKSCKGGGRGGLGARNMCVMLPLSFGALPSLAAPAEASTDAVKTVMKCAQGGEGISQMLCRLVE